MKKKIGTSKSMKKYGPGGTTGPGPSGPGPSGGGMVKTKSPGGSYVNKTTYDNQGNVLKEVERRTVKGLLTGAPKAKGVIAKVFKKGGMVGKPKMSKGGSAVKPTMKMGGAVKKSSKKK
jgi:hypothetical protein